MWLVRITTLCCMQLAIVANKENEICPQNHGNHSTESVVALVLARGGSRGIPLKNLAEIDGSSLLARTLRILLDLNRFHSVWVSTEDDRIAGAVERDFPGDKVRVHHRPVEAAQDHTSSLESVREFVDRHPWVENVALVQCTSPFLRLDYLQEALDRFQSGRVDCVFSATRSFKLRWKRADNGRTIPLNFDPGKRPRRQDWEGELVETGMFYFARKRLLLGGHFQNENCEVVVIDDKDSLEIDSFYDLELARKIIGT
ncbi:N-acylneuraminate cytidylyltransferase A [Ochlerotatus camptorhynchus]|uniref:N-acylneuraminate cytidylyltransferase A n=1 Tax=Ochlerotatus camptorhynchus TaxID=644619 RepID=UPI0031D00166